MSVTAVCNQCGFPLEHAYASSCPRCASELTPPPSASVQRSWGVGKAFLVWIASVVVLFVLQLVAAFLYLGIGWYWTGERPAFELNTPLAMATLVATLIAHGITLVFCWWVVTGRGTRPFWQTLGWKWHPQFKSIHAVALALMMLGFALILERVLPHGKTDFERLLDLGFSVRIFIVILAVATAPFVEEIVYRGLIYAPIENASGWKICGYTSDPALCHRSRSSVLGKSRRDCRNSLVESCIDAFARFYRAIVAVCRDALCIQRRSGRSSSCVAAGRARGFSGGASRFLDSILRGQS